VAGGAPLLVSELGLFPGAQPIAIDPWDVAHVGKPQAHLNTVPANGTFLTTTAGSVYRVAGGAPFAISSWSLFGAVLPSVTVDEWDIANLSSSGVYLHAMPRAGTVVEALPSRSYWIFAHGRRRLTASTPAAVPVDEAGLAAFPAVPCVVPRLRRLTLAQARHALQRADCRLGAVMKPGGLNAHAPRVVSQSPRSRTPQPAGARVDVAVG